MHTRRLACLLLGLWLGGSAYLGVVASQNFLSVERLLREPLSSKASAGVEKLGGTDQARLFLRHYVGEQNRFYFEAWEIAQFVLGGGLFLILLFGTREGKGVMLIVLAMLALVSFVHFGVTPSLVGLGRELDFTPPDPENPLRAQFQSRHILYSTLELMKTGLGLALAALLVGSHGPRRAHATSEHPESAALHRSTR